MNPNNKWWYEKTYKDLCDSRVKLRGTIKRRGDGYNKHHIIPKCIGGKEERSNYVLLTFREHIIAHALLHEIYPNSNELAYAFLRMIQSSHSDRKENMYKIDKFGNKIPASINFKKLEELRNRSIEYLREINIGRKQSPEAIEKMRQKKLGQKYSDETKKRWSEQRKGHVVREDTREKISLARVGMEFSTEHKENISKSHKGKKQSPESIRKRELSKLRQKQVKVISTGIKYSTVTECSKLLNVSEEEIFNNPGKYELLPRLKRKIQDPEGNIFDSLSSAAKYHKRDDHTIKNWIEKHPEKGFKYI